MSVERVVVRERLGNTQAIAVTAAPAIVRSVTWTAVSASSPRLRGVNTMVRVSPGVYCAATSTAPR